MVAIVAGAGLGLDRSSAKVFADAGQQGGELGSASFGRFGENVYVNAITGNLMIDRADEVLIGLGLDDVISRGYNSLSANQGYKSHDGWQWGDERCITNLQGQLNQPNSTVTRIDADGSDTTFTWDATAGAYICHQAGHAGERLIHGASQWEWIDAKDNITETYDDLHNGRLVSSVDNYGHGTFYNYDPSTGLLSTVSDSSGESTTLTWGTAGTVPLLKKYVTTKADGSTLTSTRYAYDASNRLKTVTTDLSPDDNSVTDGNTVVTTYTYDGTSDRVATITQTGGAELDITYALVGSTYRVATLTQFSATTKTRATSFTYNTNSTTVTDGNGQTVLTFDSSGNGQLLSVQYPADHSGAATETYSYTYNSDGQLATVTDPLNHTTTYQYDSNDNLHIASDAFANTVTYSYDANNHVTVATQTPGLNQAGTTTSTRYAYNSNGMLRFVVDGDNEVTEYQYDTLGNRTNAIIYRDSVFNVIGYGPADPVPESALSSWASGLADRSNLSRVDYTYDFRGNVLTETTYEVCRPNNGNGNTSAATTVVTYTYDQFGNLRTRNTSGMTNTEVFTYDGLNRLATSTDLNGVSTSVVWNDAQNTCTATVQGGITRVSTYDLAGELVMTSQSAPLMPTQTISYKYDGMGRLSMVTDGSSRTTYYLYDNLGRKTADIAADGSITEYRYDTASRLVATIGYATKLTANKLGQLIDITGNPTNVPVQSILPSGTADDVWNWRVYDKDNRLVETIARDGSATILGYDNRSNVISTTSYYKKLDTSGFYATFPTAIQTPVTNAEDDNTRLYYDAENRQIGMLDGNGNLSQVIYDHAGNTIETVSFGTQVAGSHRGDGFASLVSLVANAAKDLHTHFYYDDRGLLRFTLDAKLRPTEYQYDAAGNQVRAIEYSQSLLSVPATIADMKTATGAIASNADNRTSWNYYDAANGRLLYSIDPDSEVTSYLYDALGNVSQQTRYSTRYDGANNNQSTVASWISAHTGVSFPDNRITRYAYDAAGRLMFTVDAENYVTENRYDQDGRIALNIRYAASYTLGGAISQSGMNTWAGPTIPSSAVQTAYLYDTDGRLSDTIDDYTGLNIYTHTDYDALGRISDVTVADNNRDSSRTHYTYDTANRVLTVTAAYNTDEAATTSYTYNGEGRILTSVDPDTNTTSFDYDAVGNMVKKTDALNNITTYTYDAFGNVRTTTDPLNNVSYFYYDKLNRLTGSIDQGRYVTVTSYTIGGAVASVTRYANALDGSVVIDPDNMPLPLGNALDATTLFERDKLDRVTKMTDAEGFYEHYQLDAFGDRVKVWAKSAAGKAVDGTVQEGGLTTNTYDHRGLLLSETLPVSAYDSDGNLNLLPLKNTYTYDSRGNMKTKVEADGIEGRTTTYTYDNLNRLTKVEGDPVVAMDDAGFGTTAGFIPATTYQYDKRGNVIEVDDPDGARTLSYYDELNRKIAEINPLGTMSAWTYDGNGNVLSSRVYGAYVSLPHNPGGDPPDHPASYRETTYTYDAINRLTSTSVANLVTGVYTASGYTTTLPITVTTANHYNKSVNSLRQIDGIGNSIWTFYDKLGRAIGKVDQDKYVTLYELDANGNVTKETRYAASISLVLGDNKSLDDVKALLNDSDPKNRVTIFTYDRNGRRLTEERQNVDYYDIDSDPASQTFGTLTARNGVSKISYTYNGLGEVLTKAEATLDQTSYLYDAAGRQVEIDLSSFNSGGVARQSRTLEYYDGLNDLVYTDQYDSKATGTVEHHLTHYSYGPGGRLAWVKDAENFVRNFAYDKAGRVRLISYDRTHSDGTKTTEGDFVEYDLLGRTISQGVAKNLSGWGKYESTGSTYDVYGEVEKELVNGVVQKTYEYDDGGRLFRSKDEGVFTMYLYDKAGHLTLSVTTDGVALPNGKDWSTMSIGDAIALMTDPATQVIGNTPAVGMIETIDVYDARGQQTSIRQPQRQLSANDYNASDVEDIVTSKTYNAFGEVMSEKNGRGYTTNYTYNNLGKVTQQILPQTATYNEHNERSDVNPTQTNYYDISGRLIGVSDANGTINGYVNTRALLANTGYDGSDALVIGEKHADGGQTLNTYDVFGNMLSSSNEILDVTTYVYDKMGRLKQETHPLGQIGSHLFDSYTYDELGQRLTHTDSAQTGIFEKTDYDAAGRVNQVIDMEGHKTTYAYAWDPNLSTAGLGQFGGWTKTTTLFNSGAANPEVESTDAGGRMIAKTDFGGNHFAYGYDTAGRLVVRTCDYVPSSAQPDSTGEEVDFVYYNSGLVKQIDSQYTLGSGQFAVVGHLIANYSYDRNGNEVFEEEAMEATFNGTTNGTIEEYEVAAYNSLDRMTSFQDKAPDGWTGPLIVIPEPVTTTFKYDANGNIRNRSTSYVSIDENGLADDSASEGDWYVYDRMNRFTLTKGRFVNGSVGISSTGTQITYNTAGQRTQAMTSGETDDFSYADDGYLTQTKITTGAGVQYAKYTNDLLGRVTYYEEDNTAGHRVYSKQTDYNDISQAIDDTVYAERANDGYYTWSTTYDYQEHGTNGYNGVYDGGVVTHTNTTTVKGSTNLPTTDSVFSFIWFDSAHEAGEVYKPDTGQSYTYTSTMIYDQRRNLSFASIRDGYSRDVDFTYNIDGLVTSRIATNPPGIDGGMPTTRYFYFGGNQMGDISNDGTSNTDYVTSIQRHTTKPGDTLFRNGGDADPVGDFDQSYQAINGLTYGQAPSTYSVQSGDTLQSIAQAVWGDASFWYLIAEANGLDASSTLVAGMNLIIPNKVANAHNNTTTYNVYDPNEHIGDISPTHPPKPQPHHNGCGVLGQILLAVVAIVVSVVLPEVSPFFEGFWGGVAAAGVGNIVSQGVGLATGIQKSFSWGSLGMSLISAGVSGGLDESKIFGTGFFSQVAEGAASSAITQGIGVATGLQKSFNWADVAAAGMARGVGSWVKGELEGTNMTRSEIRFTSGMAGDIASAATKTLIDGSDFGDNIVSGLPGVIGNTIGGAIVDRINASRQSGTGWTSEGTTGATVKTGTVTVSNLPPVPQNGEPPMRQDGSGNYIRTLVDGAVQHWDGSSWADGPPVETVVVTAEARNPIDNIGQLPSGRQIILFKKGLKGDAFDAYLRGALHVEATVFPPSPQSVTVKNNSDVQKQIDAAPADMGGAEEQAPAGLVQLMTQIAGPLYNFDRGLEKGITIGLDADGNYVVTSLQILGTQGGSVEPVADGIVAEAHTHGAGLYEPPEGTDNMLLIKNGIPSFVIAGYQGRNVFEVGRTQGVVSIRTVTSQYSDTPGPWEAYQPYPKDYRIYNVRKYP